MTRAILHQFPSIAWKLQWTFQQSAWTIDLQSSWISSPSLARLRPSLNVIAQPVFRGRMVVHPSESAGKIKLIGEAELVADLLDGQLRCVEQLHGALHAQVVEVAARRVTGQALKQRRVVRPGKIHQRRQRCYAQIFPQMPLHELNALG